MHYPMVKHPEENGLRTDLREAALARDWSAWQVHRLVLADWLADHQRPEAALARTDWIIRGASQTKRGLVITFAVALPRPLPLLVNPVAWRRELMLFGTVNSHEVLHALPGEMRLLEPRAGGITLSTLRVSWMVARSDRAWFDLGAHHKGWLALFPDAEHG